MLRPVLFINTPRKVNNPHYERIGAQPLEVAARFELGGVIEPGGVEQITQKIDELCTDPAAFQKKLQAVRDKCIYNVGSSGKVGATHIINIAKRQKEKAKQ